MLGHRAARNQRELGTSPAIVSYLASRRSLLPPKAFRSCALSFFSQSDFRRLRRRSAKNWQRDGAQIGWSSCRWSRTVEPVRVTECTKIMKAVCPPVLLLSDIVFIHLQPVERKQEESWVGGGLWSRLQQALQTTKKLSFWSSGGEGMEQHVALRSQRQTIWKQKKNK
jgi:hypothetical protein